MLQSTSFNFTDADLFILSCWSIRLSQLEAESEILFSCTSDIVYLLLHRDFVLEGYVSRSCKSIVHRAMLSQREVTDKVLITSM